MSWETDFVEPDPGVVTALVAEVLADAGDRTAATRVEWVRSGSSTLVGLARRTAVRIGRTPGVTPHLLRSQRLVDALPDLPFAVPRSRTAPVTVGGITAVGTERLPGRPRPPGRVDVTPLRTVLDAVHGVGVSPLAGLLAAPKSFCGGDRWRQVLEQQAVTRLPSTARPRALAVVAELADQPVPQRVLGHGDLAGANLLWVGDRISAVLDWDLASHEDPAEDVASLAGWFGWDLAPGLADAATVGRARVFHRAFPLMVLGFTLLHGRPDVEVGRAVDRVVRQLAGNPLG